MLPNLPGRPPRYPPPADKFWGRVCWCPSRVHLHFWCLANHFFKLCPSVSVACPCTRLRDLVRTLLESDNFWGRVRWCPSRVRPLFWRLARARDHFLKLCPLVSAACPCTCLHDLVRSLWLNGNFWGRVRWCPSRVRPHFWRLAQARDQFLKNVYRACPSVSVDVSVEICGGLAQNDNFCPDPVLYL